MRLTGPWKMKRGALGPPYRGTLRFFDRQPIDLSPEGGIDHVDFVMRKRGETVPIIEARATILQDGDQDIGCCQYDWVEGDTDLTGIYRGEFVLYDLDGRPIARVPSEGYQEIQILGNLSEFYDFDQNGNGDGGTL